MINAIIPIPARYPVGYMLGGGFRVDGKRLGVSGRTIKVLPLYFYKFWLHANRLLLHGRNEVSDTAD